MIRWYRILGLLNFDRFWNVSTVFFRRLQGIRLQSGSIVPLDSKELEALRSAKWMNRKQQTMTQKFILQMPVPNLIEIQQFWTNLLNFLNWFDVKDRNSLFPPNNSNILHSEFQRLWYFHVFSTRCILMSSHVTCHVWLLGGCPQCCAGSGLCRWGSQRAQTKASQFFLQLYFKPPTQETSAGCSRVYVNCKQVWYVNRVSILSHTRECRHHLADLPTFPLLCLPKFWELVHHFANARQIYRCKKGLVVVRRLWVILMTGNQCKLHRYPSVTFAKPQSPDILQYRPLCTRW